MKRIFIWMTGRLYVQMCRKLLQFDAERGAKVIEQKPEFAAERR